MVARESAHPAGPPRGAGRGLLLVISGPSGVGKTSIVRDVLARFGGDFSVSATTRKPGPGEVDGRDYLFIDERAFQRMVDSDLFLEHAQVFGRNWYGTPREPVERAIAGGRIVALDIDVQGAEQVRARHPDAFCIFVLPPSEDELLRRLRARGREDEDAIRRRFAESTREIARATAGTTYDAFVTNDDLARATEDVCRLIAARIGRS
jgi:guanylate kinase